MTRKDFPKKYYRRIIVTPLGNMVALADEDQLYLLEFVHRRNSENNIKRLLKKSNAEIVVGVTYPISLIEHELELYFNNRLTQFSVPFNITGTPFQVLVWEKLQTIASGTTCSYSQVASAICKPRAFRAVAQAIGANQFAVLIPCHRVINASGALGGYSSGLERKKWLIEHEAKKSYNAGF